MAFNIQTLMPSAVSPNSQVIVSDIDNDGWNEMIIFDNVLKQLSVVHHFKYTDFTLNQISPTVWPSTDPGTTTPVWTQDTDDHWWTIWSAQNGSIPAPTGSEFWTIGESDRIIAADLDGDGFEELFIFNPIDLWWGILKWSTTANAMQMIYAVSMGGPPPSTPTPNEVVWQASAADQYFVIPNINALVNSTSVPANAAGLLLYNSESVAMGMISYSPTPQGFLQWWTHTATTLTGGWNLTANNPPSNQFYPGFFASATKPSIVVYDSQDQYIDLMQWSGSDFTVSPAQGGSVGNWNLQSSDEIRCADLNADGITEILIYSPSYGDIAVFEWNNSNSQFQSYAISKSIGTAPTDWTVGNNDNYYFVYSASGIRIFAFSSNPSSTTPRVAVLVYESKSGSFSCQWANSALSGTNPWTVTAADTFYAGSPSSTAQPPLFTTSTQGPATAPVYMLGAVEWSGNNLQVSSSALMPVLAWSVGFLASAPHTKFKDFKDGDQPAIYTYISSLFPVPGEQNSGKPIRHQYHHSADSGKFYAFALLLNGVTKVSEIPKSWPKPDPAWTDHDWHHVVKKIVAECNEVDTAYGIFNSMGALIGDLSTYQNGDLDTVNKNMQALSVSHSSSAGYWGDQIGIMILWGLAAAGSAIFPGEALAASAIKWAVGMSMFASIAGSAAGFNPSQQKQYPAVADMQAQLTNTLSSSIATQSKELTEILKDPVKLMIANGLSETEWKMDTSLASKAETPFQHMDRVTMYQNLMPYYYSIDINFPPTYHSPVKQPPPVFIYNGMWYSLYGQSFVDPTTFQSSDMYTDLFTTLGVSEVDFFVGNGGWDLIPRKQG